MNATTRRVLLSLLCMRGLSGCSDADPRPPLDAGRVSDASPVDASSTDAAACLPGFDASALDGAEPQPEAERAHRFYTIHVLDEARVPLPGVTLSTVNHVAHTTDRNGVVAFYEPGLMEGEVWFSASLAGYEVPPDALGQRGRRLRPVEGGRGELIMRQIDDVAPQSADDRETVLASRAVPGRADCFFLRVVDAETERGVPLVAVQTGAYRGVTDSQGVAAICDAQLLASRRALELSSHGYLRPERTLEVDLARGGSLRVNLTRRNIARRLYRITGQGIYRDSLLLGLSSPLARAALNAKVMGQDSVLATLYRGRMFWIWGDTNRSDYPLGNFRVTGARSDLPPRGGIDPQRGVDLTYFEGSGGFVRAMVEEIEPVAQPTWLGSLVTVAGDDGEALFATYMKPRDDLSTERFGMVRFDDARELFVRAGVEFPLGAAVALPEGQPVTVEHEGGAYVYFGSPVRVPATARALADGGRYETFTARVSGELARTAEGQLAYAFRSAAPSTTRDDLARAGLDPSQALDGHARDVESGAAMILHGPGAQAYNSHRQRYVRVLQQRGGASSLLGELYYFEADTPLGPWVYGRKVITHDDYSFYNPWLHPEFSREGGRYIQFEATYTKLFAGSRTPRTPRYDYNQIMYELDLDDPRLAVPVPIYELASGQLASQRDLRVDEQPMQPAFYAPDRAAPSTVAISPTAPACASARRLTVGVGQLAPLFYALPPDASARPAGVIPLYEWSAGDGSFRYGTRAPVPGARVFAYVWPSLSRVPLAIANYRGRVRADAGPDQCLLESERGAGAELRLDASKSTGSDLTYSWRLLGDPCPLATGSAPRVRLPAGVHEVILEVSDARGKRDGDSVLIAIDTPER